MNCKKCICRNCMNVCRPCNDCHGVLTYCKNANIYTQMTLAEFMAQPKRTKEKLARFITWEDYGISQERYHTLKQMCQNPEYAPLVASVAHTANETISGHILLSVTKNKSYEGIEYSPELGRIPCGRTDFYGYRRLFYHLFNERVKENGKRTQKET